MHEEVMEGTQTTQVLGLVFYGSILFMVVFWMVVGWRAMRAHETIAKELHWFRLNYKSRSDAGD